MWATSDQYRDALAWSHRTGVAGAITLDGNELAMVVPDEWRITRTLRGSQIESELTMQVTDPDGSMTATPGSALRPWGQRVALTATVSSGGWAESIPLGVWRLNSCKPSGGVWRLYPSGKWARPPSAVDVSAGDLLDLVADYDWLGLSVPPSGATSYSELSRVVDGALPVRLGTDSVDVPQVPWEGSRIDAVTALASAMGAVAVVDRTGILTTVDAGGTGDVVEIAAADEPGHKLGLIEWDPSATRDGIANGVAATGTDPEGVTLYGRALEQGGPAAWSAGGFGRVTYGYHSPLLTTQSQVNAAAATRLASLKAQRAQMVTVTTMPDPSVDVLDTARLTMPGAYRSVDGLIVGISLGSSGPMVLTVSIPWEVRLDG